MQPSFPQHEATNFVVPLYVLTIVTNDVLEILAAALSLETHLMSDPSVHCESSRKSMICQMVASQAASCLENSA